MATLGTCLLGTTFTVNSSQNSQPPGAITTLIATIVAVDTEQRTLKLTTKGGRASRVMWMSVPPACRITVAGAAARLGELKPADIVSVRYRRTPEGNLAISIKTI